MKLINNTKIPDKLLEDVILSAARSLNKRVRTMGVVVQVNQAKYHRYSNGTACECSRVRWIRRSKRWIKTDGGAFKISIPFYEIIWTGLPNFIELAEMFFNTARHEWGHIRDYQNGGRWSLDFSNRKNGKRPKHCFRPEEKRVADYIESAEKKGVNKDTYADCILNLAIELESQTKNLQK